MNASPEQSTLLCISDASTFVVGSYTWKAVSDRDTLEDLSQSPRSPFKHDRKLLILNGEMSEWLKEHAWKALGLNSVETYGTTFSAAASAT
jgi:hypothetical protein